jgi:phosphatidylserine/phosphatidylglycerophosphate/cardiolipin synthase-like enzyme
MRTFASTSLLFALLLALPAEVSAQELGRGTLTPAEEAALRAELKRLEVERSRYDLGASGFEGIWKIDGNRTVGGAAAPYTGELVFERLPDGKLKITGKCVLVGRTAGKWEGAGAIEDGKVTGTYKATIAGEGKVTFSKKAGPNGGALSISFESSSSPKTTGDGAATRALPITQKQLETKLFEANAKLQAHRYARPEPIRYRTATRKTEFRFTPTVEWDPKGVEQDVIDRIDRATRTIDLCVFEFSLMKVAEALVRAKERGVKIRMVYDNREEEQPAIKLIKEKGISARSDGRAAYMHNKFMLVDGINLWTGSTNLAPGGIYIADNNAVSFKDAGLAGEYQKEFDEMFVDGQFGPRSPRNTNLDWMVVDTGVKLQVRFSPEDECMSRLVEAVKSAKKSIKFMAFAYTSKTLYDAMAERIAAGVKVEGIFESRHAGWADIKIGPLHALGATVRFDRNPNAMHHKVIVIDDRYLCTGSFNFSDGADVQNDENLLIIDSRPMAQAAAREFANIMTVCDPNDPRIATSGMGGGTTHGEEDTDRGLSDAVPGN